MIENPKFLRKGETVLKRSQRRVSHKVKGSSNREKNPRAFTPGSVKSVLRIASGSCKA